MQSISPLEALRRLNEPVTVEMLVRRAKSCKGSLQFFLDSEENHRDARNLGLAITEGGVSKFKEAKINNPAVHFKDKTIRVQGTVILKENRPYIEVDDPSQIEIVG
ncbi:hypothetical protein AYO44_11190 [Planctomycetaceae bacterium SCGC AG-212-F19]|nr:hypothetical protein AYO44_11190 [Planctomycetaceae bacterium SCGC AG-212-F19]